MALFKRSPSAGQALAQALEQALGRIYDSQAKQIEAFSGLLSNLSELSMKRAAQALGARGGKRRADRAAERKRATQVSPDCRLCKNPAISNPTATEIVAHQAHEAFESPPTTAETDNPA